MSGIRVLAGLLWIAGCASLMLALECESVAVECTPEEYSPAACERAHEEPSSPNANGGPCHVGDKERCVASPGSQCGADMGFGMVVPGRCQAELNGSNPTRCTLNYGITVVILHRFGTRCAYVDGACTCEIYAITDGPSSHVQVCDCATSDI